MGRNLIRIKYARESSNQKPIAGYKYTNQLQEGENVIK